MFRGKAVLSALVIIAAGACSNPTAHDDRVPQAGVLQVIDFDGAVQAPPDTTLRWTTDPGAAVLIAPRTLVAPDTVQAGVPFEVEVTTIGLDGCWSAYGQSWRTDANVVEITPTDAHSGANICTEVLQFLKHSSSITIAEPGAWQLRVEGRRVRMGDQLWTEPVAAEKRVIVR